MPECDLILDGSYNPSFLELSEYIEGPSKDVWYDLISFMEENYKCKPKMFYSRCSAKPGWNIKYQKSGKSLCTLYPEKDCFTALVVIGKDEIPKLEENLKDFGQYVIELYRKSTLFNGTYWLMIKVTEKSVAEDVKRLFLYKLKPKK